METYIGYIKTPQDALLIFEACRKGQLNRVQRRLSSKERIHIQSGSIFAWDEKEAGMRRWTDGKTWSPSRVLGSFLTYRELDTKRRPRRPSHSSTSSASSHHLHHHHHPYHKSPSSSNSNNNHSLCSYKQDGLIKQSFSICTSNNQKLHLISYYNKRDVLNGKLKQPTMDPLLSTLSIPQGLYPDLTTLDLSSSSSVVSHHDELESQKSSTPPPSLSSSPCTSDEDLIMMDLSSSSTTSSAPPLPPTYHHHHHPSSHHLLPIQDIAWGKIPCSEDQRQLQALQGLLKL
ncbi:Gti1/Pac2 family-domain-containing protein [Cunninghamella echinulata]|nr:Gti1/Pac2 family-domain-containing protein [Cunninghamella echinulata]